MFCPRCGAETDGSARYCSVCGATLPRAEQSGESKRSIGGRLAALVGGTRRERIVTASTLAAVAVAVAAFFALDTGGDDDGGRSGRVAVADIRAADAACVEAKRTIRRSAARALRSEGGDLEAYSADFLRAVLEFRAGVRSLESGPDIDQLDEALGEVAIEAGALSRVAREQPKQAGARVRALDAATAEAESAIVELGLDDCAAVQLDPRSLL